MSGKIIKVVMYSLSAFLLIGLMAPDASARPRKKGSKAKKVVVVHQERPVHHTVVKHRVVRHAPPAFRPVHFAFHRPGYVWVPGHWSFDDYRGRWVWVRGHYMTSRVGHRYVEGRWIPTAGGYIWEEPRWVALR